VIHNTSFFSAAVMSELMKMIKTILSNVEEQKFGRPSKQRLPSHAFSPPSTIAN